MKLTESARRSGKIKAIEEELKLYIRSLPRKKKKQFKKLLYIATNSETIARAFVPQFTKNMALRIKRGNDEPIRYKFFTERA